MSKLADLEVMVRALGLPYQKKDGNILLSVKDKKYGEIGVVVSYDENTNSVRITAPLDVEPYHEALSWFLSENFTNTTYKYAIDYDGFVAVVYDLPANCIKSARDLREAIVEVVEGAKKVLERTEAGPEEESHSSPSSS